MLLGIGMGRAYATTIMKQKRLQSHSNYRLAIRFKLCVMLNYKKFAKKQRDKQQWAWVGMLDY